MEWNKLSMSERAEYIKLGVKNGITSLDSIKEVYNSYAKGGKVNRFDGKSQPTQQMNVNYYDPITGKNYGNIKPDNMVQVTSFDQLTSEAQNEYQENHPTDLDELIVYPTKGKGAKSTTIGSYYDALSDMTEYNRQHTQRVAEADALVRETSAFEKPLNFLSPGQWFGAGVNYLQGESPFWEGIYHGNSGWVPDKFAEENPRASVILNALGDVAPGFIFKNIATPNKPEYLSYKTNTLNRRIGAGTLGYEDILKTGVVRGKEGAPLAPAAKMRKIQKALESYKVSKKTREKLNSQQIDKSSFEEVRRKLPKNHRHNIFSQYDDFDAFLEEKQIKDMIHKANVERQNMSTWHGYDWANNWGDNTMATFAYPDEFFSKNFKYSGDYAVQINNANKYARKATELGHFAEHPVTEKPMSFLDDDVSIYVKQKSLNPFKRRSSRYREISTLELLEDMERVKRGLPVKTKVRYNNPFTYSLDLIVPYLRTDMDTSEVK